MTDEDYIRRAIRLAMTARGHVEPNPMVACVLVRDGRVIGEGFHGKFGGPHAEPSALADCAARGHSPAGATAYVTLEPCCHTNKKTPPCAPKLIEAKVARVVIGCLDPNPQVNGNGVAMLRAAGIAVDGPLLEAEARQLIAPFLLKIARGRPYVTLKWAQTADGKVAGPGGRRLQITGPAASQWVHQLRARADAILVGINTVLADDPLLTVRNVNPARPLLRVVLDGDLRLPLNSRLVLSADPAGLLVYTHRGHHADNATKLAALRASGVDVQSALDSSTDGFAGAVEDLGTRGVTHLLVEGGPKVHRSAIQSNLADRLWVFRSRRRVDDASAPAAVDVPEHFVKSAEFQVEEDRLTEYLNTRSPAFFAAAPSADFVLAAEVNTAAS